MRTIRWYQSEGLLPRPRRAGRVAMYDAEHLSRLEAIRDLQAHGLTLTAIRRLLDRAPGTPRRPRWRSSAPPWPSRSPTEAEVVTLAEVAERLGLAPGASVDPAILEELGIVAGPARRALADPGARGVRGLGRPRPARGPDGRPHPSSTRVLPRAHRRDGAAPSSRSSSTTCGDPASPAERRSRRSWAALTEAVARLRPLGATSVASMFDNALARAAEEAAERVLDPDAAGD